MKTARATAAVVRGNTAYPISIEVTLSPGPPEFTVLGISPRPSPGSLALNTSAQAAFELRSRVSLALSASGLLDTRGLALTVNLGPSDFPKDASLLDLAVALAILEVAGKLPADLLHDCLIVGELALDGAVRTLRAAPSLAQLASRLGSQEVLLPYQTAISATLIANAPPLIPLDTLQQAFHHLTGSHPLSPAERLLSFPAAADTLIDFAGDLSEVRGQKQVKRVLEIAAAGGHDLLMMGTPGTGKTMLARRLPSLFPDMTPEEAEEVTAIHALVAEIPPVRLLQHRPFRSPHFGTSSAGILGGGSRLSPGEITLAHHGVLFLDELLDFRSDPLEAVRNGLRDRTITLHSQGFRTQLPARPLLVAAVTPCPCGYRGATDRGCTCSPGLVQRYQAYLAKNPLAQAFSLFIDVPRVSTEELRGLPGESSATIRARVAAARLMQADRFKSTEVLNRDLDPSRSHTAGSLNSGGRQILDKAAQQFGLTARQVSTALAVARTIADLAQRDTIEATDVAEAINYRLPY
jgi:magnesium chelatase family protein